MTNNDKELKKRIDELEEAINETDVEIAKAYAASELMIEPIKSIFIRQLKLKEESLNDRKDTLADFKLIAGV